MRNRLFIIAVLAIGMATCFGSCKKKTVEPSSDPTPTPTENYVCKHDSLVFVVPVEPTAEENGCIAHYICGRCGEKFIDASATTPVENTILWATSYAFDNDNIIENDFAQWAGDESYLLRACRGNLGNSGWENWTDAQWKEYYGKMYNLYQGWGGQEQVDVNSFLPELAIDMFSALIGKTIENTKLDSIVRNIMSFFEEDDHGVVQWAKINGKLDTIMMKLDDIQNSINSLTDLVITDQYRTMMQRRYEKQVGLMNLTYDYFNPILRLIAAERKPYDSLSADAKEKIKNLTEAWHNTPVGGTNPELELMNMLQFMKGDFLTGTTLPGVYDYIAYHDTPWEHQAYTFREMTRTADVMVMIESYLMNLMYYETHREETYNDPQNGPTFIHQQSINILMAEYMFVLYKNKIVYHHDHFVCQIPNATVSVEKKLYELRLFEYIRDNKPNMDPGVFKPLRENLFPKNGAVYHDWFPKVYQYYAKTNPKEASNDSLFLYNKLKEVGFQNLETSGRNYIVGNCDCEHSTVLLASGIRENVFYHLNYENIAKRDYISYHTAIDKRNGSTIGTDLHHENYKKAVVEMTVTYKSPYNIQDVGRKTNNNFYVIEIHK